MGNQSPENSPFRFFSSALAAATKNGEIQLALHLPCKWVSENGSFELHLFGSARFGALQPKLSAEN